MDETYEHEGARWHREPPRGERRGAPCGRVQTRFNYRVVWQVDEFLPLSAPLDSQERIDELEAAIAQRLGLRRVRLVVREEISRS